VSAQESPLIAEVRTMAGIASDAQAALVAAVRRAVHGGEMVTMVAEAALTTRPTIYRMLKSADEPGPRSAPPSSMWASVLDEAMMDLLDHVGEATVAQLQAGISSRDPVVKVRRFELGLKNRRGSIGKGSPEWGRYVDASAVVAEMRRQKMVPNPGG
jgi:hypothetical protein